MRTLHIFQNGLSIAVRQDFRAYLSRFVTDTVTTITLPYLSHSRTDQIIILETLLEIYVKNMKTYILKHNVVQTPRVHTPIPSDLPPFTAIITTYHKTIHTENLHAYVCSPNFFFVPYSMAQGMPSTLHSLFRIDNSLQVQCFRYSFLGRFSLGCSKRSGRSSSIPSTRVSHEL